MSGLIERLFFPNAKDLSAGLFQQRHLERVGSSLAAALVQTIFSVTPVDTVRLVTGIGAELTPGAAQTFLGCNIVVRDGPGGAQIAQPGALITAAPAAAAGVRNFASWSGEVWLFPGEVLMCECYFSAGGVANGVAIGYHAIEFPRGNIRAS
jgi:hypothetical protein